MHKLVRQRVALARTSDTDEKFSLVDIDSLVSSIIDDAADVGDDVRLGGACDVSTMVKPNALARCLGNLIDNAVKYAGAVEVRCHVDARSVVVLVEDRGPGIPHGKIETMFLPFVRGETSRSRLTGGTGLGLAIARAQSETFGGSVILTNRSGGGLCARISFPR